MKTIKLSETTANRKAVAFTAVAVGNQETRLDASALTFTIRVIKPDGTSSASAGSGGIGGSGVTQPDVANARGVCYYTPGAADINVLGEGVLVISAAGMETREIPFNVVAYDPYDATALGLGNINVATATRAVAGDAMTLTAGERGAINAALLDFATAGHTAAGSVGGAITTSGGGGGSTAAQILGTIIEGPSQYDGNGEASADPTMDISVAGALRELLAYCANGGTGLNSTPFVLKSRVGGRNRTVGQIVNGNRSITSHNDT
jgi:hypothetical protein